MSGKLTKMPRAEQWADRICIQLGKTVESIFEIGRLLAKAKAELPHGEWLRMFDEGLLPFQKSWAAMFMAIAGSNLPHFHDRGNLPPVVGTLYQLTKADKTKLRNALKDGVITPGMKRRDVKALLPPAKVSRRRPAAAAPASSETQPTFGVFADDDLADRVRVALRPAYALFEDWPEGRSPALFIHAAQQLLKRLERLEARTA